MFRSVSVSENPHPDVIVLGTYDDREVSAAADSAVIEATRRKEYRGKLGDVVEAFPASAPRTLVVGLGSQNELTPLLARKAAAAVGRRLASMRAENAYFDLGFLSDQEAFGQAIGETIGLQSWGMDAYRGSAAKPDDRVELAIHGLDEGLNKGLVRGLAIARSANIARSLVATPPNEATPMGIAARAEEMAREVGLGCRILQGEELVAEKLVGLETVGQASVHKPCLIRLEYRPASGSNAQPVVLLGKTITYDTGGLTLKISNGMRGMKGDKAGGCAVFGAMHAVATVLKPDFPVIGLLVAAENSVSENAYRPDDVITYRNGVTVEVTNTDAEGRLVLADGLCWACDFENPAAIIDLATLTGGVVTALGSVFAGLFANDDALAEELAECGRTTGDRVWRLPLDPDYTDMMKSDIADIINSNPNRKAHPIQGAAFLEHFVKPGVPWAHIDIAGVSQSDKDSDIGVAGPTGYGVRLLVEFLRRRVAIG